MGGLQQETHSYSNLHIVCEDPKANCLTAPQQLPASQVCLHFTEVTPVTVAYSCHVLVYQDPQTAYVGTSPSFQLDRRPRRWRSSR